MRKELAAAKRGEALDICGKFGKLVLIFFNRE